MDDQPNEADRPIFDRRCLAGRRYFVTGASSGIGRQTALMLARHGARVAITGRDQQRLDATLGELQGSGHGATAASLDTADRTFDVIKQAAAEVPFDGIFHAAGTFGVLPAKVTKQRQIDEVFGSSVPGAYGVARAAAMKKVVVDGGSIVFMSSVAGVRGNPGLIAYAGAKAAILGLNVALAVELAPRRVRVNAIVAGTVETEMHLRYKDSAGGAPADANEAKHLFGYGRATDVANAVLFLMSDAGRWITGSALTVDGGHLA